jgi:hypothetical protein
MFADNADLTKLWLAGMEDREGLSSEERWWFGATARAYMHVCETMFVQAELGSGDVSIHVAEEHGMKAIMASPGLAEWWAENPYGFCEEVRNYVARLRPPQEPAL